jgi:BlaI family transcriptional regulator, penicillinase repressor
MAISYGILIPFCWGRGDMAKADAKVKTMAASALPQRTKSRKPPSLAIDLPDYRRNFQSDYRCTMPQISEAEARIMEALWRKTPLTAEQIFAAVGPANGWAPATVKTLVTRLLKKKAISGGKEGDSYCYRPLVARADYVQSESQGLLDRLFKGEVAPLVAHFAENRQLSAKDLRQLKALITKIEEDKK